MFFFSLYLWARNPKFFLRAFPPPFVTCINITQWLWSFLLGYDLVPVTKTTINLFKFFQIISNSFAHEVWNLNRCLIFFLQCYCFKNIPLTLLDTIAGNYLNIFTLLKNKTIEVLLYGSSEYSMNRDLLVKIFHSIFPKTVVKSIFLSFYFTKKLQISILY